MSSVVPIVRFCSCQESTAATVVLVEVEVVDEVADLRIGVRVVADDVVLVVDHMDIERLYGGVKSWPFGSVATSPSRGAVVSLRATQRQRP